jgi:hypothetical protein
MLICDFQHNLLFTTVSESESVSKSELFFGFKTYGYLRIRIPIWLSDICFQTSYNLINYLQQNQNHYVYCTMHILVCTLLKIRYDFESTLMVINLKLKKKISGNFCPPRHRVISGSIFF